MLIVLIVVIVVIVVIAGANALVTYNRLARLRVESEVSWANIETDLERRVDILDNAVGFTREYAGHERGVFADVAEARSALGSRRSVADVGKAEKEIDSVQAKLLGVAESYPELKADARYAELSRQLEESTNRVTANRRYYNQVVNAFNAALATFPSLIWAKLFGFHRLEPYGDEQRGPLAGPRYGTIDSRGSELPIDHRTGLSEPNDAQ